MGWNLSEKKWGGIGPTWVSENGGRGITVSGTRFGFSHRKRKIKHQQMLSVRRTLSALATALIWRSTWNWVLSISRCSTSIFIKLVPITPTPTRPTLMVCMQAGEGGGVYSVCAWPQCDRRPSHPYFAGMVHVGFPQPGRHWLHQARSTVRYSASCMEGEPHPTKNLLRGGLGGWGGQTRQSVGLSQGGACRPTVAHRRRNSPPRFWNHAYRPKNILRNAEITAKVRVNASFYFPPRTKIDDALSRGLPRPPIANHHAHNLRQFPTHSWCTL